MTDLLLPGLQYQKAPGVGTEVRNFSTAAQVVSSTTRVQIAGTLLEVPSSGLKVGSMIRFVFDMTKTAAGSALSTFDIAFGTAGTVADTARVSLVKSAGTAAIDEGKVVIEALVRSVSATGVVVGTLTMSHRLLATGHSVLHVQETTISSGFDNDGQELFISLNLTAGASDAITIQMVKAELTGV